MLNSSNILALIQEDAPCVYDILMEEYFRTTENKWVFPTPDQLLDILKEYSGDNHDVHYWSWRYAQMIETDAIIKEVHDHKSIHTSRGSGEYRLGIEYVLNKFKQWTL